ncbi:A24 family peptidase [Mycoplasmatota bacterium zrk1]
MFISRMIIGIIIGILSVFLGSNVVDRKEIFKGLKCYNCGDKVYNYYLKCDCGKDNKFLYLISVLVAIVLVNISYGLFESTNELNISYLFILLMVSVSVSDILDKIVPDELIIIFLTLIGVLRIFIIREVWFDAYLGMMVAFTFFYVLSTVGEKLYKQEVLGGGDIKLYAIIGLVLGVKLTFLSVFFASVFGLIFGLIAQKINKETLYIPFVPFITVGVFIAYFYGDSLLEYYINLF